MLNQFHGVVACSGNGIRFASSVGKKYPYPKHLEKVGEKTLLEIAIDGIVRDVPVSSVTTTLNPLLVDLYLPHLFEIQKEHPTVEISYVVIDPAKDDDTFYAIEKALKKGVRKITGEDVTVEDQIIAASFGDTIIVDQSGEIRRKVEDFTPLFEIGRNLDIGMQGFLGGTRFYYIFRKGFFTYFEDSRISKFAVSRGVRCFNINDISNLEYVRRILGFHPENEINRLSPRKE